MDKNLKKILWILFSALLILFGGISALNHINQKVEERVEIQKQEVENYKNSLESQQNK